jgi:hypothetical protein
MKQHSLLFPISNIILSPQAEFYRLTKEYEKAEPLYMEAIEILEQSFGPDDIRYFEF